MKHFSHSSLATWRRCRYKFYLGYKERLVGPPSIGQARGTAGHRALAYWYKNNKEDEPALQLAFDTFHGELLGDYDYSEFEILEDALVRYFNWGRERDKWVFLEEEKEFDIPLSESTNLVGFIDGIVEMPNGIWILENKFNKQVSTRHLDLDPQVSIYMFAARAMGYKPQGVMYNIIRMSGGPTAEREPAVRTLVYRNPEGLAFKKQEILVQAEEMRRFILEGGAVYRNETKDCHWDCPFYKVCLGITDDGVPLGLNKFALKDTKLNEDEGE